MSLLNDLPPRHYADATGPYADDGKPILVTKHQHEYDAYITWLAEYLYVSEIPLHPRQIEYAAHLQAVEPETAVFEISDWFGYAVWELDSLDTSFESGEDWPSFDAAQREAFASFSDAEREESPFEEWSVSRGVWERRREEWVEKQALSTDAVHADIPYRSLLSCIFKRVPDQRERVRLLREYFANFQENASK